MSTNENYEVEQRAPGASFTDASFKTFMSGTVIAFLVANGLQSVTVDDGCGHKGTASVTSKGEYKVQRTSTELM